MSGCGKCVVHEKQGMKKFKRLGVTVPGPNGRTVRRYRKQVYWICDVDQMKGGVLKQTQLSFTRTTTVYDNISLSTTAGQENNDICMNKEEKQCG